MPRYMPENDLTFEQIDDVFDLLEDLDDEDRRLIRKRYAGDKEGMHTVSWKKDGCCVEFTVDFEVPVEKFIDSEYDEEEDEDEEYDEEEDEDEDEDEDEEESKQEKQKTEEDILREEMDSCEDQYKKFKAELLEKNKKLTNYLGDGGRGSYNNNVGSYNEYSIEEEINLITEQERIQKEVIIDLAKVKDLAQKFANAEKKLEECRDNIKKDAQVASDAARRAWENHSSMRTITVVVDKLAHIDTFAMSFDYHFVSSWDSDDDDDDNDNDD